MRTLFYIVIIQNETAYSIIRRSEDFVNGFKNTEISGYGIFLFLSDKVDNEQFENSVHIFYKTEAEGLLKVEDFLKEKLKPEDEIIFRYPQPSKPIVEFFEKYPKRIWLEHHSKELIEIYYVLKAIKFRDYLYYFKNFDFSNLKDIYSRISKEKKYGNQLIALAKGGFAVTNEINEYQTNRLKEKYNCHTVGNSYNFERTKLRAIHPSTSEGFHLIMACTTAYSAYGTDRLIKGLKAYSGQVYLTLHLVGNFTAKTKRMYKGDKPNAKVIFYPKMTGEKYHEILNKCHLGIGSLGFHRWKSKEGATLKIREYIGMGFPFIFSHYEIDISNNPEFEPFYLKISENEETIDFDKIVLFLKQFYNGNDSTEKSKEIRKIGENYLSCNTKSKEIIRIINKGD